MLARLKPYLLPILVVALAAFGGSGVALVALIDNDGDGTSDRTVRILDRPGEAAPIAPAVAEDAPLGDLELPAGEPDALKDSTPEDVPDRKLDAGADRTDEIAEDLDPRPVGGAQNYSCRQDFSGGVYSSRNGASPTEFVLHYTVSPNRPGPSDVLGILNYFESSRVASSTYIIDFEGNCVQMVPFSEKPWTQGAANPYAVSVEIIATGRETTAEWLASPLIRKGILASLTRDNLRRMGAPLRYVDPVGCVFPPGYTDHDSIECGNNHTDVSPAFPFATFQRQLVQGVRPAVIGARYFTPVEKRLTKARCTFRARLRKAGKGTPAYRQALPRARRNRTKIGPSKRRGSQMNRLTIGQRFKIRHRGLRLQGLGRYYTGEACR